MCIISSYLKSCVKCTNLTGTILFNNVCLIMCGMKYTDFVFNIPVIAGIEIENSLELKNVKGVDSYNLSIHWVVGRLLMIHVRGLIHVL